VERWSPTGLVVRVARPVAVTAVAMHAKNNPPKARWPDRPMITVEAEGRMVPCCGTERSFNQRFLDAIGEWDIERCR
jgi:hypothetical protein